LETNSCTTLRSTAPAIQVLEASSILSQSRRSIQLPALTCSLHPAAPELGRSRPAGKTRAAVTAAAVVSFARRTAPPPRYLESTPGRLTYSAGARWSIHLR